MVINETYKLSNGIEIPKIGLGTWFINDGKVAGVIKNAVSVGYRLIDTAFAYGNEKGVGKGVRNCGLPREEIFVTTKLHADVKTYEEAKQHINNQLEKLGLDYIDLYIIHAPQPWGKWRNKEQRYFKENVEVWKALEESYKEGKLKAIGVSNFLIDDLQNILDNCEIKPMVNQILNHVGSTPTELINFCKDNDILVQSYAPLGHGKAIDNKEVKAIAEKYGVSVSRLCMRYVVQMGTSAIPKTTNIEHMKSNADIDFNISDEDMEKLKNINFKGYGLRMRMMPVFSGKTIK